VSEERLIMRRDEPVTRIMTETVVVIELERPVSEALDCFRQYGIHHLPVVRGGRLAGMLSSADLLKLEHFLPKAGQGLDSLAFIDERFTLGQLMRTPVVKVTTSATVADAAETLIASGVHAVPVVDEAEHVVGIVSSTDLIQSLLNGPPRRVEAGRPDAPVNLEPSGEQPLFFLKPTDPEFASAMAAAQALHVEDRDPRYLGKTLLYLAQRARQLEKVLERADRFLRAGQDEHNHALLLKAILRAKRVEEHATGQARVPFPLE
jgi:CBS domain-containing protein